MPACAHPSRTRLTESIFKLRARSQQCGRFDGRRLASGEQVARTPATGGRRSPELAGVTSKRRAPPARPNSRGFGTPPDGATARVTDEPRWTSEPVEPVVSMLLHAVPIASPSIPHRNINRGRHAGRPPATTDAAHAVGRRPGELMGGHYSARDKFGGLLRSTEKCRSLKERDDFGRRKTAHIKIVLLLRLTGGTKPDRDVPGRRFGNGNVGKRRYIHSHGTDTFAIKIQLRERAGAESDKRRLGVISPKTFNAARRRRDGSNRRFKSEVRELLNRQTYVKLVMGTRSGAVRVRRGVGTCAVMAVGDPSGAARRPRPGHSRPGHYSSNMLGSVPSSAGTRARVARNFI
ncbi:hypothetical protein EVAR_102189_1 [Eumeta japonica]|uniref:Uncharacterized protein n=1 Tax=Eumeta variegata TaxID=151549 RepID=A0A4C2A9J2_EUMVA|nr:hypothetical protein EVAR_102189_1 [Eumeta japonica]